MLARLTRCGCRAADISRRHTFFFSLSLFELQLTVRHERENACVVPQENNLAQRKELFLCVCLSAAINTKIGRAHV